MTLQEYFGTIQQSFVEVWKNHLETSKFSDHKALNDYYDDIVDAVDKLIEDYQGIYGKLGDLKNTMDTKIDDPIAYLSDLKNFVKDGRKELIKKDDTEIWSDIDEVLSIIDSTLYKLKELGESKHKSLRDYLVEAMKDVYTGNHAIHEILLQMWNDELMTKKVKNVVKQIENYLKRHPEATFEDVLDDFSDEVRSDGLEIDFVGNAFTGLDSGDVGIDQDAGDAFFS